MNQNIQALRAIAALAVLLFHALPFFTRSGGEAGPLVRLLGIGYLGVDLFFVISGFIIARGLAGKTIGPVEFRRYAGKRACRIFSGYWPVLAAACLYYQWAMPERLEQVNGLATVFLLSHRIGDLVIGQAWSLSFELCFYLICGLLAMTGQWMARAVALAYGLLVVVLNLWDASVAKGFWANPHWLELLAGMGLGFAALPRFEHRVVGGLRVAVLLLLVIWATIPSPSRLVTVALVGSCGFLLVLLAEIRHQKGNNPTTWLTRLGDSSYALYLWHYLGLEIFVNHLAGIEWLKPAMPMLFLLWLASIVILAHAYTLKVERPLYRMLCRTLGLAGPEKVQA